MPQALKTANPGLAGRCTVRPTCYSLAMQQIRTIAHSSFVKGLWRNGRGVSWDIASDQPFGAAQFGWRLALAEIAADEPFSHYESVDRVFTLLEGPGIDLEFAGGKKLAVHERHVPHAFACDVPTTCTLVGDRALVLNLFTARGVWQSDVVVLDVEGSTELPRGTTLLFVLEGTITCNGTAMARGNAAQITGEQACVAQASSARIYVATLRPVMGH